MPFQTYGDEEKKTIDCLKGMSTLPSVKSLEIEQSNISELAVGHILDKTPCVTSLVIWDIARDTFPAERVISKWLDCTALAKNIAGKQVPDTHFPHPPRSKALEHLSISITFYDSDPNNYEISRSSLKLGGAYECGRFGNIDAPVEFGIKGSFGSMKNFTSLKILEISPPVLLGWHVAGALPLAEILPNSLSKLTLLNEMSHWVSFQWHFETLNTQLRAFVESKDRGRFRVIEYHIFEDVFTRWKVDISELRKLCKTVDIRFETVSRERGDEEYDWDDVYDEVRFDNR